MTHRAKIVYDILNTGDPITDADLEFGRTYYRELAVKLTNCGPVFQLAANEANRVYRRFDDFYKARRTNSR